MSSKSPMEPMKSTGTSGGYVASMQNHRRIANCFLAHTATSNPEDHAKWGEDIMLVPELEVTTEYFFGLFATYISSVHVINSKDKSGGEGYASVTAEVIFNSVLNQTRERLKSSTCPQTQVPISTCTLHTCAARSTGPVLCAGVLQVLQ